jgi:hypothetical protein
MNNIPLVGQVIIEVLSIIGFSGIVGLLFGRWLARGHPRIFLIGVEPATGEKLKGVNDGTESVMVSQDIVQLYSKFDWANSSLDDGKADFAQLREIFSNAQEFSDLELKALKKAETLLGDLEKNGQEENRIRIMREFLNDSLIRLILMDGVDTNALIFSQMSDESSSTLLVEKKTDFSGHDVIAIQYPFSETRQQLEANQQFLLFRQDMRQLDSEVERRNSFVAMIRSCNYTGLEEALTFVIKYLREQYRIADQLAKSIGGLIQKTYWQVDVMAANTGERIVLLSPYAQLITRGSRGSYERLSLPLTFLSSRRADSKLESVEQEGTEADSVRQRKESKGGEQSKRYEAKKSIALKAGDATQITFLADVRDNDTTKVTIQVI